MFKKYFRKPHAIKILIITLLSSIIIYQLESLKLESNTVRSQQIEKFSYSLTNFAASQAARYLSEDKNKELQSLINSLSEAPVIKDASIYDKFGEVIYQSEGALGVISLLKINQENKEEESFIPYITELYSDKVKIGYLRITVKQDDVLSLIHDYENRGLAILQFLIMLSFITGMIVMAVLFKIDKVKYKDFVVKLPLIMINIKTHITTLIQKSKNKTQK